MSISSRRVCAAGMAALVAAGVVAAVTPEIPAGAASIASASSPVTLGVDRGVLVTVPRDAPRELSLFRAFDRGTIFSVAVFENASTGYTWKSTISPAGSDAVAFLDTDYVSDQVGGPPGTGGTRYFRYQAMNLATSPGNPQQSPPIVGEATITLSYQRPWEPAPIQQVVLRVCIR